MRTATVMLLLVAMATDAMAGRRRKGGRMNCPALEEEASQTGQTFMWTRSGLRENGLQTTFGEGAFALDEQNVVYKYPTDRMVMLLGLQKAKVVYDYTSDNPVAVIRLGRRGWGPCVLLQPEYDSYEELMQALEDRNMTNLETLGDEAEYTLQATQTTDTSGLSQFVTDLCAKDHCGRPMPAVYFRTELVTEDTETTSPAENPVFLLLEDRVAIAGVDTDIARTQRRQNRRNWRQQRRRERLHNTAQDGGLTSRQQRRQERRQQRRLNRRGRHRGGAMMAGQ